jgi:hypothetical protein
MIRTYSNSCRNSALLAPSSCSNSSGDGKSQYLRLACLHVPAVGFDGQCG